MAACAGDLVAETIALAADADAADPSATAQCTISYRAHVANLRSASIAPFIFLERAILTYKYPGAVDMQDNVSDGGRAQW